MTLEAITRNQLPWNHGDPLTRTKAEEKLKGAPVGTWLLRYSNINQSYAIAKKVEKGYQHVRNLKTLDTSVDNLVKGFSAKYHIHKILLNDQILRGNLYFYGPRTVMQAKKMLFYTIQGTWLLRYSEKIQKFVFSIKSKRKIIHLSVHPNYENNSIFTFDQLIQNLNVRLKFTKIEAMNHLGFIYSNHETPKQVERIVTQLFITKCNDGSWNQYGVTKLSRHEFNAEIYHSYLFLHSGIKRNARGEVAVFKSTMTDYELRILQLVHGDKGIVGKGGMKIAKKTIDIETRETIILSKFHQVTEEIEADFPEISKILKITRELPYIARGHYFTMESVKTNIRYSYILSDYAESTLEKEIDKGLTFQIKKKYISQLLTALEALHANEIAHRDIKPNNVNIFLDSKTQEKTAALTDFDFATMSDKPQLSGCIYYLAPEIAQEKYKSNSDLRLGDVYSMGSTFYALIYHKHLWYGSNITYEEFVLMPEEQKLSLYPEPQANTLNHLIWEMMHPNPLLRPTAAQAKLKYDQYVNQ